MWLPIKPAPPVTNARRTQARFIIHRSSSAQPRRSSISKAPAELPSASLCVRSGHVSLFIHDMNPSPPLKSKSNRMPCEPAHCCGNFLRGGGRSGRRSTPPPRRPFFRPARQLRALVRISVDGPVEKSFRPRFFFRAQLHEAGDQSHLMIIPRAVCNVHLVTITFGVSKYLSIGSGCQFAHEENRRGQRDLPACNGDGKQVA